MSKNKFYNRAVKIIEDGITELYGLFEVWDNSFTKDQAIRYFTLCFYPDYNIRFVESSSDDIFGPSDVMFNGDIVIGISDGIKSKSFDITMLENILEKELKRRDLLNKKSLNNMFDFPYNETIRSWCAENFSENIINSIAELKEYGNTQIGALYKEFLDETDELRIDFFKEIGRIYKKTIYAEF